MTSNSRYVRSACSHCRQLTWLTVQETGERSGGSSSSTRCSRCRLNLSTPFHKCGICLDLMTDPFRYVTVRTENGDLDSGCWHAFCRGCMREYVRSRIADGAWRIRCPGERCAHLLVERDLVKLLFGTHAEPPRPEGGRGTGSQDAVSDGSDWKSESRALLDRYRALRSAEYGSHLRGILRRLPGATGAIPEGVGPTANRDKAGTASLGAAEKEEAPVQEADALPMQSFEEAPVEEAHAVSAQSFEDWALDACQACPKCLVVIRKEVGCDHMVCLCGEEFCYGCGAPCNVPAACLCRVHSKQAGRPRLAQWLLEHHKLDLA